MSTRRQSRIGPTATANAAGKKSTDVSPTRDRRKSNRHDAPAADTEGAADPPDAAAASSGASASPDSLAPPAGTSSTASGSNGRRSTRRRKTGAAGDVKDALQPPGSDRKGRSRSGSVGNDDANAAAAATAASSAANASPSIAAPVAPSPVSKFGLLKRTVIAPSAGTTSHDPSRWTFLDTKPAPLHFDPAQPFTHLTLVTYPRRRHHLKVNLHVTVRQLYAFVKHLTQVTEPFDLLYSYPHRILANPDNCLHDYQFDNISMLQRLYSEIPPASTIGRAHQEHQDALAQSNSPASKQRRQTQVAAAGGPGSPMSMNASLQQHQQNLQQNHSHQSHHHLHHHADRDTKPAA
jgi:hypothetical protein